MLLSLISVEQIYLEKWDRIDYNRVKFLEAEPRFPLLPAYSTCVPRFEQPSDWDDFYGSRMRTYFVPTKDGYHFFKICKILFRIHLIWIQEIDFTPSFCVSLDVFEDNSIYLIDHYINFVMIFEVWMSNSISGSTVCRRFVTWF